MKGILCLQVIVVILGCSLLANAQLNCPQLPPRTPPTTIFDLHPNVSSFFYLRYFHYFFFIQPWIFFYMVKDIKVVMTLGDSITAGVLIINIVIFSLYYCILLHHLKSSIKINKNAGFGIMGLDGGLDEFRGKSWAIGADSNATTLFNFLKFYTPNLIGGSVGSHVVGKCTVKYTL